MAVSTILGDADMETCEVLKSLRDKHGLTQEALAERLFVTRQAVSRWENGETMPNTDTLRRMSSLFGVSINTLLGSPRQLVCQCCGMPLTDDGQLSRETDDSFNEEYCKWCYADGKFTYGNMEQLLEFLVGHMSGEHFPPEQARAYFTAVLPKQKHWSK